MNPILGLLGMGGNQSVMLRAVQAWMSGQSAEDFMSDLARTDKRFAGVDVGNLERSARNLCGQKGVDAEQLAAQVKEQVKTMM